MLCAKCSSPALVAGAELYLAGSIASKVLYRKHLRFILHAKDMTAHYVLLTLPRADAPWTVNVDRDLISDHTPYRKYASDFAHDSVQKAAAAAQSVRSASLSPWKKTVAENHERYHLKTVEVSMQELQEYAAKANKKCPTALFALEQIVPMTEEQLQTVKAVLKSTDAVKLGRLMSQIAWQTPAGKVTVDAFTWDFLHSHPLTK